MTKKIKDSGVAAGRLIGAFEGEPVPVGVAGDELGFTPRQIKQLQRLFGDSVPDGAITYLHSVHGTVRFDAVNRALSSREGPAHQTRDVAKTTGGGREDEIERFFTSLLDPAENAGRCAGWEIDEAVYEGHGVWTVKIGIYPWGKTIASGTKAAWREFVDEVLGEIGADVPCPSCGQAQDLKLLMGQGWTCACGARFFVRHGYLAGGGITREDCWERLRWALLHVGKDYRSAKTAIEMIEAGADLEDVFVGTATLTPLNTVVHVVTEATRPRAVSEMPGEVLVEVALDELGFQGYVDQGRYKDEEFWKGTIGDDEVVVVVDTHRDESGYGGEPPLQVGIRGGSDLLFAGIDRDDFDTADDLSEAWGEFAGSGVPHGEWEVWDAPFSTGFETFSVGAIRKEPLPTFSDAASATSWLESALRDAVKSCISVVSEFREHSEEAVAAWRQGRDDYRRLQAQREAAERAKSEACRRAFDALREEYRSLVGGQHLQRPERRQAETALRELAKRHSRTEVAAFINCINAHGFFSNSLYADLVNTWPFETGSEPERAQVGENEA